MIKKIQLVYLSILCIVGNYIFSQSLVWEVEQTWGYTQEILTLDLQIPETAGKTIQSIELDYSSIDIKVIEESARVISKSYSSGEKEKINSKIFRLFVSNPGEYTLTGKVIYADGSVIQSEDLIIKIAPLPFSKDQNQIIVRQFSDNYISGIPGNVIVEAFVSGSYLRKEDLAHFITKPGITAVPNSIERWLYLNEEEHYLLTIPLSVIYTEPGKYKLLESSNLEISNERWGGNTLQFPVIEDIIIVQENKFTENMSARADFLELSTLYFPNEIDNDQEQYFYIFIKTDGLLYEDSLTHLFNLPTNWTESFNSTTLKWHDNKAIRSYQFVYIGTFENKRIHNFGSLELDYGSISGALKSKELILGKVKGESSQISLIIFILIAVVISSLILFLILLKLQKIRIKQKKPADLPLRKIDSSKIGDFSRTYDLTKREQEILSILVYGKSTKEISNDLYISPETTKKHIKNIMRKTQANSRLEILVKIANF